MGCRKQQLQSLWVLTTVLNSVTLIYQRVLLRRMPHMHCKQLHYGC